MTKTLYIKHSGRLGDIIYCLMAVIPFSRKNYFNIHFLLDLNPVWANMDNGSHPFPGMINSENYESIKNVIIRLGYNCSKWNPSTIQDEMKDNDRFYVMDAVKQFGSAYGMPYGDIRRWYYYAYPELNVGRPWHNMFAYVGGEKPTNMILVSRTKRYQNPYIDYGFLNKAKGVFFMGLDEEYEEFKHYVPTIERVTPQMQLEHMVELIKDCKLFIGNQSFFYSIAEYFQVPRLLEVGEPNNVIPQGRNGFDFHTQEALEFYFKIYANS